MFACRRTRMITCGCTSRSTSKDAQVRRASCTMIFGAPALLTRSANARSNVRGSTAVPYRPVMNRPDSCQLPARADRPPAAFDVPQLLTDPLKLPFHGEFLNAIASEVQQTQHLTFAEAEYDDQDVCRIVAITRAVQARNACPAVRCRFPARRTAGYSRSSSDGWGGASFTRPADHSTGQRWWREWARRRLWWLVRGRRL